MVMSLILLNFHVDQVTVQDNNILIMHKWSFLFSNTFLILSELFKLNHENKIPLKEEEAMLCELQYEDIIGESAITIVSRYVDENGHKYAVKKLKREFKNDEATVKRFKREIDILHALKGEPHIVPLIAYNEDELWYIMPYAEQNLQQYITSNHQLLNIETRTNIFERILDGISIAHSRSILHRNLTPQNILLIDGEWYISGFGVEKDYSRFSQGGYCTGTYYYAAPEQVDKLKDATIQSDIYSLGKILYFVLTGREPSNLRDAPSAFKFIIKGAISEKIEDRFENVSVLKKELLKNKMLQSKLSFLNWEHMTVREYLSQKSGVESKELYEVIMKSNIYDHVYYDFIEPIINYFDNISEISKFVSDIGEDKALKFIKLFIQNLNHCYARVGWPFSAMNSFGYFLNRFFKAVPQSSAIQLECLKEMWELASYHDQWAIQDLIIDIITKNQVPAEIEEELAYYISKRGMYFVKLKKLNASNIHSRNIAKAIQSVKVSI